MADQYDYFFLFTNAAAAQADATVGPYWNTANSVWQPDVCIADLKVVTAQAVLNGIGTGVGFWIMISSPTPNATLAAHPNMAVAIDRNVAAQGGSFVLATTMTSTGHATFRVSPVPAGSIYPQPLNQ